MRREMLYDLIYALAARDGRDAALFGPGAALAHEAFVHSLAADAFPELWFELPLAGDPWFDLHALTSRDDLAPGMSFSPERTGNCPEAFAWFAAASPSDVRQLALSYDVSSGSIEHPAVQLLSNRRNTESVCDFLAAAGRADVQDAYRAFCARISPSWYPCYAGVFPARPEVGLRVECIPDAERQQAYAADPAQLAADLARVGLDEAGDTLLERCKVLSQTPFPIEFQFNVTGEGLSDGTVSASLRFAPPTKASMERSFFAADELMRQVERWGLADDRWQLLRETAFSRRATLGGESMGLYCFPAFVKLRWRHGEPVDAKTYLMAGVL